MLLYSAIIVSMYNPDSMDSWQAMLEMFPEEILRAMNFNIIEPTFLGYIAGYYYGFIMIMFPMIYISIMGQRSIAKYVDNGSMSFLLATPNTRIKVATTQGFYMLMSTIVLLVSIALLIGLIGIIMFPGALTFIPFLLLNINVIGLFVLLSGIAFLASCVFNEVKHATLFGAGIPIMFFVINMLANVSDDLAFFKYFTVFTLFDSSKVLALETSVFIDIFILYVTGALLYLLGIRMFNKKDLHI
jgi:ABC-2 type transport system permease protein